MSIQSEITRLQTAKANLKTSLENKGATVPSNTTLDGYPAIVNNLPDPKKFNITIHDLFGEVDSNGVYHEPETQANVVFTGIKKFADEFCMMYGFANHPDIRTVSFPDLEDANKRQCLYCTFTGCINLTSVSFPKLADMSGYSAAMQSMFSGCTSLTSLNLGSLTKANNTGLQYVCNHCSNLTSVNLDSLQQVSLNGLEGAFRYCKLTNISLPALTEVYGRGCTVFVADNPTLTSASLPVLKKLSGQWSFQNAFLNTGLTTITFPALDDLKTGQQSLSYCFQNCASLTSVSFPALKSDSFGSYTNQFNNMLSGVTGCTVHFPSNLQSVIGSWSDVTAGFGGTNTTVLFDLPATK